MVGQLDNWMAVKLVELMADLLVAQLVVLMAGLWDFSKVVR